MQWLVRTLTSLSPPLLAFVLVGCSDDGLAPPADTDPVSSTSAQEGGDTENNSPTSGPGDTGNPATTGHGHDSTSGEEPTTGAEDESGSDTGSPTMTCEDADQCVLINDCCQCAAAHVDDEVPECVMNCLQPTCDALGIPNIGVVCGEDGTCELEPIDCSGNVACDSLPPRCPPGTLPEVSADGTCWTGACMPEQACDSVPSCDFCDDHQACVHVVTQLGPLYSCQAVPEACGGAPTCECMPADTCERPYDTCEEENGTIVCSCPAC